VSRKHFEWIVGQDDKVHDLLLLQAPTWDLTGEGSCWEASCLTVPCWYSDAWVATLKAAAGQNFQLRALSARHPESFGWVWS
jgi:hypothetical protein